MRGISPDRSVILIILGLLAGCAGPVRQPGESQVACIHRLYDFPARAEPFATATAECAGNAPVDLTGDRYFQVLAARQNIPFVSHDKPGTDHIVLTGSRLAQPTSEPPPPELSLH